MTETADMNVRAVEDARSPTLVHPGQGRLQDPAFLNHLEESAQAPRLSARTVTGLSVAALVVAAAVQEAIDQATLATDQVAKAVALEVQISFIYRFYIEMQALGIVK